MARAAEALAASPHFRASGGRAAGHDHLFVTTGCDERLGGRLQHARERLGPLGPLLRNAIVGRDHAYSPVRDRDAAVGSCTIEVPYVSNPHASRHASAGLSRTTLLSFQGSDGACCAPGRWIRKALHKLVGYPGVSMRLSSRDASKAGLLAAAGPTHLSGAPEAAPPTTSTEAAYQLQGRELAQSVFCLVPAGDYEVSSRFYSAIAARCVPVVISDRLAGAFASSIDYDSIWLKVKEKAFLTENVSELILKLSSMGDKALARRRAALEYFRPDVRSCPSWSILPPAIDLPSSKSASRAWTRQVVYDAIGSRVGDNLVRTAFHGCLVGSDLRLVGTSAVHDPGRGMNCSCSKARNPNFWWGAGSDHVHGVSAELCRCGNGAASVDCLQRCPFTIVNG